MDRLPLELLHTVCRNLPVPYVADFRLVSKTFAAVGTEYLLPTIHTLFHPDSLERLESISKHPVFSRYVTSLFHEGETLEYFDRDDWEEFIFEPPIEGTGIMKCPLATASDREKRAYRRALRATPAPPRHRYSSEELAKGWENYQRLLEMQETVRMTDDTEQLLREAMSRLPHLRCLRFTTGGYNCGLTYAMERLFGSALVRLWGDDGRVKIPGYGFFTKLLLAADLAKIRLEYLDAGIVDWRFLFLDDSIFARVKNSVRHLKALSLFLLVDKNEDDVVEEWNEDWKFGRFRKFVTASQDLQRLALDFLPKDPVDSFRAPLGKVVGEFTWLKLEWVGLSYILASEEQLLGFFERHAGTLKWVYLRNITLSDGVWISTLQRMRQILSLERISINGLCSLRPFQTWSQQGIGASTGQVDSLRRTLERYFLEEGMECPLLDPKFRNCCHP